MKRLSFAAVAVAGTMLLARPAFAQPAPTDVQFVGLSHPSVIIGGVYGGVYNGKVGGTIAGSSYLGGTLVDLWCVDLVHDVNYGQTYTAYTQNLGSLDGSYTRWGWESDWPSMFRAGMAVMDLSELPNESPLVEEAKMRGCKVVDPAEVFADYIGGLFKSLTGQELPPEAFAAGLSE